MTTTGSRDGIESVYNRRIGLIAAYWLPNGDSINRRIADAFAGLEESDFERRTHFFDGRFENLYVQGNRLPGLDAVLRFARDQSTALIEGAPAQLRCGFWLNAMAPGQSTSIHSHEENDELLSGVYYVTAPITSGAIVFHDHPFETRVDPVPGMMLLFAPSLHHSVAPNRSNELRLSVAFNIGPTG